MAAVTTGQIGYTHALRVAQVLGVRVTGLCRSHNTKQNAPPVTRRVRRAQAQVQTTANLVRAASTMRPV